MKFNDLKCKLISNIRNDLHRYTYKWYTYIGKKNKRFHLEGKKRKMFIPSFDHIIAKIKEIKV